MATRIIDPAAGVFPAPTGEADVLVVEALVDGALSLPALIGAAELDNPDLAAVSVTGVLPRPAGAADLLVLEEVQIGADVELPALTAAAALDLLATNQIEAAPQLPALVAAAQLPLLPAAGWQERVFLRHWSLLGADGCAPGPDGTIVFASTEHAVLSYLDIRDPNGLRIAGTRALPSRGLGLGASSDFLFVLVDQTPDPDGSPLLLCLDRADTTALELGRVALSRRVEPRFLWAPFQREAHNDESADFLVVTGEYGAVEVRSLDADMTLLASVETGLYAPRVVSVNRDASLDRSGYRWFDRNWTIRINDERGATLYTLNYRQVVRDLEDTRSLTAGPTLPLLTASAAMTVAPPPPSAFGDLEWYAGNWDPAEQKVVESITGASMYDLVQSSGVNPLPAFATVGGKSCARFNTYLEAFSTDDARTPTPIANGTTYWVIRAAPELSAGLNNQSSLWIKDGVSPSSSRWSGLQMRDGGAIRAVFRNNSTSITFITPDVPPGFTVGDWVCVALAFEDGAPFRTSITGTGGTGTLATGGSCLAQLAEGLSVAVGFNGYPFDWSRTCIYSDVHDESTMAATAATILAA